MRLHRWKDPSSIALVMVSYNSSRRVLIIANNQRSLVEDLEEAGAEDYHQHLVWPGDRVEELVPYLVDHPWVKS